MQRVHRWLLGAVSGFFFGLFLGTTLLLFGVIPLQSPLLTLLPVALLVLGAAWGSWGPIGRRPPTADAAHGGLVQPAVPDTPRPLSAPGEGNGPADPTPPPLS